MEADEVVTVFPPPGSSHKLAAVGSPDRSITHSSSASRTGLRRYEGVSDSKTFPSPGTYRHDCGHTHDFAKGSPVIACPGCGQGKGTTWTWVSGEVSPATVMQQIGLPSGTLTLMYTGVPPVSDESQDEIGSAMRKFSRDCQMMTTWFVGIMASRRAMRGHLEQLASRGEPLRITTLRPDGRAAAVLAEMAADEAIESIADAGEFERLYANSFVVSTFHLWEETIRPTIASALRVELSDVKADLMGEWRLLRNWIIHRSQDAEDAFFERAPTLAGALALQRGDPSLTAGSVVVLVQHLNNMRIEVNPHSLDMGFASEPVSPEMLADVARTLEPGTGTIVPASAGMAPSPAIIVFDDVLATVHERDCSQMEVQRRSSTDSRELMVSDRWVASSVVKLLEQEEHRCEECGAEPT